VGGQYLGRRKTQLCTLPISNPLWFAASSRHLRTLQQVNILGFVKFWIIILTCIVQHLQWAPSNTSQIASRSIMTKRWKALFVILMNFPISILFRAFLSSYTTVLWNFTPVAVQQKIYKIVRKVKLFKKNFWKNGFLILSWWCPLNLRKKPIIHWRRAERAISDRRAIQYTLQSSERRNRRRDSKKLGGKINTNRDETLYSRTGQIRLH
jgi:hypothetical protein